MKIAAGILAIIAGLIGLVSAVMTLFVGGLGGAVGADGANTVVGLGWGGVLFSFLVLIAGAMAFKGSKKTFIFMMLSSIGGAILGGTLVAICMVLSLVAGVLGYIGSKGDVVVSEMKNKSVESTSGSKKKWIIAGAVVVLLVIVGALGKNSGPKEDPLEALAKSPADSSLQASGELAALFNLNSDGTDLQRDNKLKELKDKVVVWTLPVYDIKKQGDHFRIQTKSSINIEGRSQGPVAAWLEVFVQTPDEEAVIASIHTGDLLTFKGKLAGKTTMRALEISPVILWTSAKEQKYFGVAPEQAKPQEAAKSAASSDPMDICFEKAIAQYKKENNGEEPSEDSSKWMWNHCGVELESGASE